MFLLPALAGIAVFRIWPLIYAAYASLFDGTLWTPFARYVGLANYGQVLADPVLVQASVNTTALIVGKVAVQLVLGLALGILMQQSVRGISMVRAAILVPTVISAVIASILWTFLYDPNVGLLNGALASLGLPGLTFLTSKTQALPSVLASTVWRDIGFIALVFFSGLQAIPRELYEAAMVDGASRWKSLSAITLPLLKKVTLFVVVTTTVAALQLFTPVYIMTRGGPAGSTRTVLYYVFEQVFLYMRLGPGLAAGVVLILLAVGLTFLEMRVVRDEESA